MLYTAPLGRIRQTVCSFRLAHISEAFQLEDTSPFDNSNGGQLLTAFSINDSGEIAGFGVTSDGEIHAFLAAPCNTDLPNCQDGTVTANAGRSKVTLTDDSRWMLIRLGMPAINVDRLLST